MSDELTQARAAARAGILTDEEFAAKKAQILGICGQRPAPTRRCVDWAEPRPEPLPGGVELAADGHHRPMSAIPRNLTRTDTRHAAHEGAHTAGLVGLVARGALYIALAVLALELVFGDRSKSADPRGAMHDLAHTGFGVVVLVILALGFALFAILHLARAIRNPDDKTSRRVNDAFWAVVNGFLAVLAASFLFTSKSSGDADQTDKTLTAKAMDMSGGRLLVGAIGIALFGYGVYLVWRAFSDDRQDERAILEAAPNETPSVRVLSRIGNVARARSLASSACSCSSPPSSTMRTRPRASMVR